MNPAPTVSAQASFEYADDMASAGLPPGLIRNWLYKLTSALQVTHEGDQR